MPIPPDHQMVGAAGGAPFSAIECPSDGARAAAADIRRVAAAALGNHEYLFNRRKRIPVVWVFDDETPPFLFYQFSLDSAYEDPATDGYVDVPNVAIGDVIMVQGMFLCENSGAATGEGGRVRLTAVDDFGGAPVTNAVPGARAYISPGTSPNMVPVTLIGKHVVVRAGTTRIKVQGRVNAAGEFLQINSVAQIIAELQPPPA